MPARPRMMPPVGKSGAGTYLHQLFDGDRGIVEIGAAGIDDLAQIVRSGCWSPCRPRSRWPPLTSRFGKARRQHLRLAARCRRNSAGNRRCRLSMIVEQRIGGAGEPRLGVAHRPPADRRPSSRNCPGRRSAAGASRNPAPCAPSRRRSPASPCGWYLPITSPTMRADLRIAAVPVVAVLPSSR